MKPTLLLFFLLIFLGCKKNEEEALDSCDSIKLASEYTYDSKEVGNQLIKYIEMDDGSFYASVRVNSSLDYKLIRLDASFTVVESYLFESEKIFDFTRLNDGRFLIASPHETGDLSLLSADFSTLERLPEEFVTFPKLTTVDDGVILTVGSGVYSTSIIKRNHELETVWTCNFGPSKPYTQHYNPNNQRLYIANAAEEIIIVNTLTGDIVNTLSHGYFISKVFFQDGYIYTTGNKGPISECKKDIFAQKMSESGGVIWHESFGSPDADDWGADIIIHNNTVYTGGSYKEGCHPGMFGGYSNYYLVALNKNGERQDCYLEKGYSFSYMDKFHISPDGKLYAVGNFSNSEVSNWKIRFMKIQ